MIDASCESRATLWRLSALYASTFILLVTVTRQLWLGTNGFPQIPALRGLAPLSPDIDLTLIGICAVTGVVGAGMTRRWSLLWIAATVFVFASFGLNQHRLQVWAYHLCVAGLLTAFSAPGRAIPRLRWLTISIYAWSALSKIDTGFVAGPGRTLFRGLTSVFSINPPAGAFDEFAPWLMPVGELLAAVTLALPRWRRVGLVLSISMHLLLLLAVGPLGLRHELGVQIWNGLFLAQNVLLFGQSKLTMTTPPDDQALSRSRWGDRFMTGLLAIVMVMPAFQPWGYWDVWPSWAVYSARGGWTTILVHHDGIKRLPNAPQRFVGAPAPLSDWHPVDIDSWSLSELHCPVYPQSRFRLAVAAALSQSALIRVERRGPPHRFSGATTLETFDVAEGHLPPEIAAQFWLNTEPRAPRKQ
jgi:hypothetical protein